MYQRSTHRCDDRIVSIHQPHVRPIVRGKEGCKTEFGSKIRVSLVDGIAMVDHLGWDAFNEGQDLKNQVEQYKVRYGYYPESVLADGIYGTRDNALPRQTMKISKRVFPEQGDLIVDTVGAVSISALRGRIYHICFGV